MPHGKVILKLRLPKSNGRIFRQPRKYFKFRVSIKMLWAHYFFKPDRNCQDSKLEVAFAEAKTNSLKIKQRIQRLEPLGTTPIAYSLGESANDFTACNHCRNIVILITDGIEECNGNPCEVSAMLQKKRNLFKTLCHWGWIGC